MSLVKSWPQNSALHYPAQVQADGAMIGSFGQFPSCNKTLRRAYTMLEQKNNQNSDHMSLFKTLQFVC